MRYKLSYSRFVRCAIVEKVNVFYKDSDQEAIEVVRKIANKKNDGFLPTIQKLERRKGRKFVTIELPELTQVSPE